MIPLFYCGDKAILAELPVTQRALKTKAAEGMTLLLREFKKGIHYINSKFYPLFSLYI